MILIPLILSVAALCSMQDSTQSETIPRIIHYVWVGPNPKSSLVKDCIQTWKRFCPGWLIVEWNDELIKGINNTFLEEAYQAHKYAFVADYLRLYVTYYFGGVYIDSDVELTNPINQFLNNSFFIGREPFSGLKLCAHLFGSVPKHPILQAALDYFASLHFIGPDGTFDETYLPDRFGMIINNLYNIDISKQDMWTTLRLEDDAIIYPPSYFWKFNTEDRKNSPNYAKHLGTGTWRKNNYEQTLGLVKCFEQCQKTFPSSRKAARRLYIKYALFFFSGGIIHHFLRKASSSKRTLHSIFKA